MQYTESMATCPECREVYPDDHTSCEKDGAQLLPDAAFAAADRELEPGAKVGEYAIEKKIGQGGFGTVYKAVHPLIGKKAAIKVLKRQYCSNPQIASRFIAEASAVNKIGHRYIIDIFSFGHLEDGRHYYAMNYLDGLTLQDILDRAGKLALEYALPILRAVGEALDAAHEKGIFHRDLKPENIFITKDGSVKLLDFGIAKLIATDTNHKTETGTMMGTPIYMSPEQCRGRDIDHRTDVYSFGVMTFQVVAGRVPFHAPQAMDIIIKHISATPPKPSAINAELPTCVDAPIVHMLQKDPNERPNSLGEAIAALERAAGEAGIQVAKTLSELDLDPDELSEKQPSQIGMMATVATTSGSPRAAPVGTTSAYMGAESMSTQPKSRSKLGLIAVVAGAAIAIAIVAFTVANRDEPKDAQRAAAPPAQPAGDEATDIRGPEVPSADELDTAPGATPVEPEATPVEPEATTVTLDIQGTPDKTRVVGPDGAELGTAPGSIELPRGEEPMTLTFHRRGYKSASHSVTPKADGILSIAMTRKSTGRKITGRKTSSKKTDDKAGDTAGKKSGKTGKKPSPDDIEDNPF